MKYYEFIPNTNLTKRKDVKDIVKIDSLNDNTSSGYTVVGDLKYTYKF